MSERTEVEVLLPLERPPTVDEQRPLLKVAFGEANRLVWPGKVLGLVSVIGAVHAESGKPALKVRFAVEAPDGLQHQRNTFAVS